MTLLEFGWRCILMNKVARNASEDLVNAHLCLDIQYGKGHTSVWWLRRGSGRKHPLTVRVSFSAWKFLQYGWGTVYVKIHKSDIMLTSIISECDVWLSVWHSCCTFKTLQNLCLDFAGLGRSETWKATGSTITSSGFQSIKATAKFIKCYSSPEFFLQILISLITKSLW